MSLHSDLAGYGYVCRAVGAQTGHRLSEIDHGSPFGQFDGTLTVTVRCDLAYHVAH